MAKLRSSNAHEDLVKKIISMSLKVVASHKLKLKEYLDS